MATVQMITQNTTTTNGRLYIAFELSNKKWKLVFGNGVKRRRITIAARDLVALKEQIDKARVHFKMGDDGAIYSCYEAGRDGFWIHRFLTQFGINNVVVDSASIEVNRRARRAKTDRIDAEKLHSMLIRYVNGEEKLWSVLHVPTVEQEDARRINREISRLKKERTAHNNRIKSLLVLHGIALSSWRDFPQRLEQMVQWDGQALPERIKQEILREYARYQLTQQQLQEIEKEKRQILEGNSAQARQVHKLQNLKSIGAVSSWTLVFDFFGWRQFDNVKQVGAAAGLAPTPYDSGEDSREQGISKAGNRRVRATMIELAWYWTRYQPGSELSRWFSRRYATGGKRMRRVGIVALARKLLVALWKYLQQDLVPEGAALKKAA